MDSRSRLTGQAGMQRWIDGGVALASRDDVTPLPGTEVFIGEASISTLWQFGIGFDSVINLANSELDAVIDGGETVDGMLKAVQAAANAALTASPSGG